MTPIVAPSALLLLLLEVTEEEEEDLFGVGKVLAAPSYRAEQSFKAAEPTLVAAAVAMDGEGAIMAKPTQAAVLDEMEGEGARVAGLLL